MRSVTSFAPNACQLCLQVEAQRRPASPSLLQHSAHSGKAKRRDLHTDKGEDADADADADGRPSAADEAVGSKAEAAEAAAAAVAQWLASKTAATATRTAPAAAAGAAGAHKPGSDRARPRASGHNAAAAAADEDGMVRLRVCSKCKAVAYCSVAHQRADWPQHKRVCKAFQDILDLTLFPPLPPGCSSDDWWNSRQAGLKALELLLLTMMGNAHLSPVRMMRKGGGGGLAPAAGRPRRRGSSSARVLFHLAPHPRSQFSSPPPPPRSSGRWCCLLVTATCATRQTGRSSSPAPAASWSTFAPNPISSRPPSRTAPTASATAFSWNACGRSGYACAHAPCRRRGGSCAAGLGATV